MPDLAPDDMDRQIEHVLGDLLIGYSAKIVLLRANLVGIAQRDAEQPLSPWLNRDDVLARGKYDTAQRHHVFLPDRLPDHRKGLSADFTVGGYIIGSIPVSIVDLLLRHEKVDVYRVRACD